MKLKKAFFGLFLVLILMIPGVSLAGPPFSISGSAAHGEIIHVPNGTIDDWSITVSSYWLASDDGSLREGRHLLKDVEVRAVSKNSFSVTCRYLDQNGSTAQYWQSGRCQYLLVRKSI